MPGKITIKNWPVQPGRRRRTRWAPRGPGQGVAVRAAAAGCRRRGPRPASGGGAKSAAGRLTTSGHCGRLRCCCGGGDTRRPGTRPSAAPSRTARCPATLEVRRQDSKRTPPSRARNQTLKMKKRKLKLLNYFWQFFHLLNYEPANFDAHFAFKNQLS